MALRTLRAGGRARVLAAMAPEARAEGRRRASTRRRSVAGHHALERASTEEEEPPFPREDGAPGSKDVARGRTPEAASPVLARSAFANDSRRAALEVLDDSETYVYMGDVENEGGWTRDDGAVTNGSDDFV